MFDHCFGLIWVDTVCSIKLICLNIKGDYTWAIPDNFARGGPTLRIFFLFYEGREDPNNTKWHFAGGPMMAQY